MKRFHWCRAVLSTGALTWLFDWKIVKQITMRLTGFNQAYGEQHDLGESSCRPGQLLTRPAGAGLSVDDPDD
jgi:hypothetical protein